MIAGECAKQQVEPEFLHDEGLRLLLFGGKGGVGKTTCAAATALSLAQRHPERLFMLVSTDPAHSLADCFDGATSLENLTLCEIDPQDSLKRFKVGHEEHLRTIALRGTFLDETDVNRLLDISMPGLDEIMALLEIAAWVKQNRYACIVVDTAPAGHTLRLLGLPEIMQQWVQTLDAMLAKHRYLTKLYQGIYIKDSVDEYLENTMADLSHLGELLQSHERCRFVPVMYAEPMSIYVTRQMLGELEQLALPVRELIVNRLRPAQANCWFCTESAARQALAIAELTRVFSNYTLWGLPLFVDEMRGIARLLTLWQHTQPLVQAPHSNPLPKGEGSSERLREFHDNSQRLTVSNPAPLPDSSMKLLLFAGKGGVGKTTMACASALYFAQTWKGKEILLFSIDPAHSLAACLGRTIGAHEVLVSPGLNAIELDAEAEFARLKMEYSGELRSIFDRDTGKMDIAFDRDVMERILDMAPPGLDEVLALTRIVELMERGKYDLFILDTAPTGHLLRFLETPELIDQWIKAFFSLLLKYRKIFWLPRISQMLIDLSRQLKFFRRVLLDARQAMLVAVTIPTEMAYQETKDLVAACVRLGVAVPILLVNMVMQPSSCPICSVLRRTEEGVLGRYDEAFTDKHRELVFYQEEPRGIERLRTLGHAMYS